MANIRITENNSAFCVTVDEYPEISFIESTYDRARNKAVIMVKAEIEKTIPQKKEEEEPQIKTVKFGFAA